MDTDSVSDLHHHDRRRKGICSIYQARKAFTVCPIGPPTCFPLFRHPPDRDIPVLNRQDVVVAPRSFPRSLAPLLPHGMHPPERRHAQRLLLPLLRRMRRTCPVAEGYGLASAFVDGDTFYAFARVGGRQLNDVTRFSSKDLNQETAVDTQENNTVQQTVCKGADGYVI